MCVCVSVCAFVYAFVCVHVAAKELYWRNVQFIALNLLLPCSLCSPMSISQRSHTLPYLIPYCNLNLLKRQCNIPPCFLLSLSQAKGRELPTGEKKAKLKPQTRPVGDSGGDPQSNVKRQKTK
jgi:hypothetical protein